MSGGGDGRRAADPRLWLRRAAEADDLVEHCYTCNHYRVREERRRKRPRWVERCQAQGLQELGIAAVVDGQAAGLVSRTEYDRLAGAGRAHVYGSPRRYIDADGTTVECPQYLDRRNR